MLRPIAVIALIGLPLAAAAGTPEPAQNANSRPVQSADASSASDAGAAAEPTTVVDDHTVLDTTREGIRSATEWVVSGVDSWFGDRPFAQGGRVAGRIRLGTLWRQDEGFDWLTRFSVRVDLPNLREKGGFLFVGRDNERELVTDRPDAFTRREQLREETRDDQSFFAGLGAQVADAISLRAGFRGGLKPYAQARYQKLWEFGQRDQFDFKETIFWTIDDHFGSTTSLVYDHLFNPSLTLRWQSAATVSQESDGFEWSSSVGLYRTFGFQRALSLETLVSGATGSDYDVSEYGLRTRWEQPIYRDWLTTELIVGYFWPRKESVTDRGRTWAIGASVQMRF